MHATNESCRWLHERLESLGSAVRYPFSLDNLPLNGINFFYEEGEVWGHGGSKPRIVRIGTHRDVNFRSRMGEHFLTSESSMQFDATKSRPHDRSIFRKNLGRALLTLNGDPYLEMWNRDFTRDEIKVQYRRVRNVEKEKDLESKVTGILRKRFSFRFIIVSNQTERMGKSGLESRLIGTAARCDECRPSNSWLGLSSPVEKIRSGHLWLVQHLNSPPISDEDRGKITSAIAITKDWLESFIQGQS
ncbi:MAG: hypothetical protein ABSA72_09045 [Nitrososphaerales archaeon]